MSKINRYHVQLFSEYLAKLKATPDGDGSLLDHMTILYGAGISNSNGHSGDNLPVLLPAAARAGSRAAGTEIHRQALACEPAAHIMDKMDYPVDEGRGATANFRSTHCVRGQACACF